MADPQPAPQPAEEVIYAPGVADMYADSMSMSASPYTITLHFGLQIGPSMVKPQVTVRMAATHAKMMVMLLKRQIKDYEERLGEIPIPQPLLVEKGIDLERDW